MSEPDPMKGSIVARPSWLMPSRFKIFQAVRAMIFTSNRNEG